MKKISVLFFIACAMVSLTASAQFGSNKVTLKSGDLRFLKGASALNIEYNYDDMKVGTMTEADYIVKHSGELNKAKPGSGDEWKVKWVSDRKARFEPNFESKFVKNLSKAKIAAGQNKSDAKYTVIIKTLVTEPGLYTGVSYVQKDTYIDVEASFVEASNPSEVLCAITVSKAIGDAGEFANYDIGLRISVAYTNCGNLLGSYIVKTLKKMK